MWKRVLGLGAVLIPIALVSACTLEEETIIYKMEEMTIDEAEERIADEIEVENPNLDINVDIIEETD